MVADKLTWVRAVNRRAACKLVSAIWRGLPYAVIDTKSVIFIVCYPLVVSRPGRSMRLRSLDHATNHSQEFLLICAMKFRVV